MKLILLFQWEFKQGSCGDLVRVCRFRLNLQISLKLLFTRGFIHWGTFDSGLSLFVQFPEGEWKSYFWLTHSLLTVVLSRSCTRLQYCSIATKRSSNSFMFSWSDENMLSSRIYEWYWWWVYVCVCVHLAELTIQSLNFLSQIISGLFERLDFLQKVLD